MCETSIKSVFGPQQSLQGIKYANCHSKMHKNRMCTYVGKNQQSHRGVWAYAHLSNYDTWLLVSMYFDCPCVPKLEEDKGLHEDWPWLGKVVDQRTGDTKLGKSVSF